MPKVFLNGEIVDEGDARVPVTDRGLLFADAVYEVVRVYGGEPFLWREHMARMERGARFLQIPLPFGPEELKGYALELIDLNECYLGVVYIQLTRGPAPRVHRFPERVRPTAFMFTQEVARPDRELVRRGVDLVTLPDVRWGLCEVKTVGLLPNVLGKEEAAKRGAFDALFVRDGVITEGTSSNFFAVRNGRLVTYPVDNILPGVTRAKVLEIAGRLGLEVQERGLEVDELRDCEEAFLTGTVLEVMPVRSVDGIELGPPGPVTRRLLEEYEGLIEA